MHACCNLRKADSAYSVDYGAIRGLVVVKCGLRASSNVSSMQIKDVEKLKAWLLTKLEPL